MKKNLTKREKLRKAGDFEYLFKNARCVETKGLKLLFIENNMQWNRIAIITKKNLGRAVFRNRIKRHIREGYRNVKVYIKRGYDFVFIPYKGNYYYTDRLQQILFVMEKAEVLK